MLTFKESSNKKSNSFKILTTAILSMIIILLIINVNINNKNNENNQDINNRELLSINLNYLTCYTETKWINGGSLNETYVKCNESYTLTSCSSYHGYTSFRYGTYSNGSICYTKDLGTSPLYDVGLQARCCKINNILGYSYPLSVNYTHVTKNMTTNSDKCESIYCPNNQVAIGSAIQMGYIDENKSRQVLNGYNGNDYINNSYNNNTIGLKIYANDSNINHQIGLGLFCGYDNNLKCFVQYNQYIDNGNAVTYCPSGYIMTSCDVKVRNNGPCNNVSQIITLGGTIYYDNLCYAYGYDTNNNYNHLVAVAVCCQLV